MNADVPLQGIPPAAISDSRRFFRIALIASAAMHAAGFLTSPYWQPERAAVDEVLTVDIADVPAEDLPKIPDLGAPAPHPEAPARAARQAPPDAPQRPSREAIREKVARRGLLRVLGGNPGEPVRDADAGLKIPDDVRYASRGPVGAADYRPTGRAGEAPAPPRAANPGIGRHLDAAAKPSAALASRVFRTDAGLEGRISGSIDDQQRSPGAIASTVRQYQSGIRYVYNRELLANPNLSGEITVAFVILPDGSVDATEIRRSSVNWPALEDAVIKRMKHWRFPASRGGPVRVVFPFKFLPEM
ncbi:MAG: TonB family protein [Deltaproteobacteria bacterium]